MKKISIVAAAAAMTVISSSAFATAACTGTAGKVTISGDTTGANFVKTDFQTPCSQNVTMDYSQSANAAWVASGSSKGACYSIGHTDAGVRPASSTCSPASPQITGTVDAAGKLTDASALGGSS